MARLYDEAEAASIIAWLDRRIDGAVLSGAIRIHVGIFKRMWYESFGTLDNVPLARYMKRTAREALGCT